MSYLSVMTGDLRQKILDASVSIIAKEGVRSLSFREVARRAGVSHQAPYHHFKNDQAILQAIAEEGFQQMNALMRERASAFPDDPLSALTATGLAYVEFARTHPGHFRVMFQNSLHTKGRRISPLPVSDDAHSLLRELADAAVRKGLAKKLTADEVVLVCWSSVHGIATLLAEGLIEAGDQASRAHLADLVVRAVGRLLDKRESGPKV